MFNKIMALILAPIFLVSNISFAAPVNIEKEMLAPPSAVQLVSAGGSKRQASQMPEIGGRTAGDRADDLRAGWVMKHAQSMIDTARARIESGELADLSVDELYNELCAEVGKAIDLGDLDRNDRDALNLALRHLLYPGAMAGFTGQALGVVRIPAPEIDYYYQGNLALKPAVEYHEMNVRDILDEAIRLYYTKGTAENKLQPKPVKLVDLIKDKSKLAGLPLAMQQVEINSTKSLLDTFKELYRAKLEALGYDEPAREEIVNVAALEIITHPVNSGKSVHIDSLYFDILTSPEIYANWEDLIIELVRHEYIHISNPTMSEEEAHRIAPINNVIKALKKRTIIIAQSGGDCPGLNCVVATATEELMARKYIPLGAREGDAGLTSPDFNKRFKISLDRPQAGRMRARPSTDIFSSREAPFKASDWYQGLIVGERDALVQSEQNNNLEKIRTIRDWNKLDAAEKKALDSMLEFLLANDTMIADKALKKVKDKKKDIRKAYDKFVNFMKHIDEYGGLIVTGGDDHCRIADKVSHFGRLSVAIPKSIDNDAMTQMLGFYKAAKHFMGRFLLGAVTGRGKFKVFIAEIMGRDAGWLALAAGDRTGRVPEKVLKTLGKGSIEAGKKKAEFIKNTTITIVPEKPVSILSILRRAQEIYKKHGVINISGSEGYKLNPKDPLLAELCRKNPLIDDVWKKVVSGKIETDAHGHPKLEGATDFLVAILTTRWDNEQAKKCDIGLTADQIKHSIFGYTGRGLRPGKYDLQMAYNLTHLAVQLIDEKKSGWMAMYPDKGLHPYEDAPIARPVRQVLDDRNGLKYPKNLLTLSDERVKEFLANDLSGRGFRMVPDGEQAGRGVLVEKTTKDVVEQDGVPRIVETTEVLTYPFKDFAIPPEETALDFTTAVKLLREDMISSTISAYTHRRSSIFEVSDAKGLLTVALSDKNPFDYDKTYEEDGMTNPVWDNVDKASWAKIRPRLMALIPGQEKPIAEIVKEAMKIKQKYGLVFIVVGTGYKFSEADKDFMDLVNGDVYLKEKYKIFAKHNQSMPDEVMVDYVSHYVRAALMKYAPEVFPSKSSVNCNPLGRMYDVADPGMEETAVLSTKSTVEDIGRTTRKIDVHNRMGQLDTNKTVVIVNEDMTDLAIDSSVTKAELDRKYQQMLQSLGKIFAPSEGVLKVSSADELAERANEYLAKGYKVIMLDNGTLTQNTASIIGGKQGEDYCVISCKRPDQATIERLPFINLNAMAMMGAGVLNKDQRLFELAYRVFTGQAPSAQIINDLNNNMLWLISVMPRLIRLTGGLEDQMIIQRLFKAAA